MPRCPQSARTLLLKISLPIILVLPLAACASWQKRGIAAHPPEKLRIAVLPARISVKVKHLKNIESLPKGREHPPDEAVLIDQRMRQSAGDITRDLEARLQSSYFFTVVADSAVAAALMHQGIAPSTATLTADQLEGLGKELGVQVLLLTDVAGYGAIKKRWLFYLIGSGFVEGLAQGVAAAAVISNPWAAAGIGAEEAAQETLEWGGGAYVFDRLWSPVILEARLVSAADGKTVWSKTILESGNRKALKALPKEERRKREVRLRLTAQKAVEKFVQKLNKKAWANLRGS